MIFPLPSICTKEPFGEFSKWKYDLSHNRVNYTVYEANDCSETTLFYEVFFFYLNESCRNISRNDDEYFVNMTISRPFPPFNLSNSSKYAVFEHFVDEECQIPVDGSYIEGAHLQIKALEPSLLGQSVKFDTLIYCHPNEGILEAFYDSLYEVVEYYVFLPQARNGICFKLHNRTKNGINGYGSMRPRCVSHKEVHDEYIEFIPESSIAKYELLTYHYDSTCSKEFFVKPMYLDICNLRRTIYRITATSVYEITFYSPDCSGEDIYQMKIKQSRPDGPPYFGSCDFVSSDSLYPELKNYVKRDMSNDLHYPRYITIIATPRISCYGEDDIETVKKNPTEVDFFSFQTSEKCEDEYSGPSNISGKSFEGRCINGQKNVHVYTDSDFCYGHYSIVEGSGWCYPDDDSSYSYHVTCSYHFCRNHNEFDVEMVCSGRGNCVRNDVCNCVVEGYYGSNCDIWDCNNRPFDDRRSCSKHGVCSSPDRCKCEGSFYGDDCQYNYWATELVYVLSIGIPITLLSCICFCSIFYCCGCCCSIILLIFASISAIATTISLFLKAKLRKFDELENIDILIQEQRLEKKERSDHSMAHLKVNKSLFEIDFSEIKLLETIGKGGSCCTVFLCEWSGQKAAFKAFRTREICGNQDSFNMFEREIEILASTSHTNIIQFFGAVCRPPRVGYLIEYCSNGDVAYYCKKQIKDGNQLSILEKLRLCREIAVGMSYLHKNNIIHRDLKPENVLLNDNLKCKIMDFGLSRIVKRNSSECLTARIGTSFYIAPEVVLSNYYDNSCDVFSFSMLSYCVICDTFHPYGKGRTAFIEMKVANSPYFRPNLKLVDTISKGLVGMKSMIETGWDHDPVKRLPFTEIIELIDKESRKFMNIHDDDDVEEEEIEGESEDDDEKEKEEVIEDYSESIFVFLKTTEEEPFEAKRFLLVERKISMIRRMAERNYGNQVVIKKITTILRSRNDKSEREVVEDSDLNELENNALIVLRLVDKKEDIREDSQEKTKKEVVEIESLREEENLETAEVPTETYRTVMREQKEEEMVISLGIDDETQKCEGKKKEMKNRYEMSDV